MLSSIQTLNNSHSHLLHNFSNHSAVGLLLTQYFTFSLASRLLQLDYQSLFCRSLKVAIPTNLTLNLIVYGSYAASLLYPRSLLSQMPWSYKPAIPVDLELLT